MRNKNLSKLERAEKRVKHIKQFYDHVVIYVIINATLLVCREMSVFTLLSKEIFSHPNSLTWINWNICIWGVGLFIQGICVFGSRPKFFKNWEKRKIKEIMNSEEENEHKQWS